MGSTLLKFLCAGLFYSSATAHSAVLMQADASSNEYAVEVTLEFDSPISDDDVKIEYINQTVQLEIPNGAVPNGKLRKSLRSSKVKSVYSYQLNKKTMRTRIIYEKPVQANMFEGFVYVKSEGNKLKIKIEDPESSMSAAISKKLVPDIVPPIDLNSELEPKQQSQLDGELSAAAVLEREFIKKIEKFGESPAEAAQAASQVSGDNEANQETAQEEGVKSEPLGGFGADEYDESKISLSLDKVKKATSSESPWVRMIISLFVIIAVGLGVFIFTKRFSKSSQKIGGNIKIQTVSQQSLGAKKSLAVIRVAGEDILIGITDYNISMIKSLSFLDDEVEEKVPDHFVSELNRVTDDFLTLGRVPALKDQPKKKTAAQPYEEQYSFANIKDIVSDKLKEMRPL
jgi:flagellar protein FliO/FliZ